MKNRIQRFSKNFKNRFFKAKDGFSEVPYLADSPKAMVQSFDTMPFSLHDKRSRVFLPDNLFFKGHLYYRQLEEGFWVFLSDLKYKKNVSFKTIYDENVRYDHFMLYFHFHPIESKNKHQLINGLSLSNCSWSLCKPGTSLSAFHFKDSRSMNITIHFKEDWIRKKILKNKKLNGTRFIHFLRSDAKHIIWTDVHEGKVEVFNLLKELLGDKKVDRNNPQIAKVTEELLFKFADKYNLEMCDADYFSLTSENRQKIQKAEKIMIDHLFKKFPGIEMIAKETGLSPTKLKSDFKSVYKQSLFQYYRNKQLEFAKEMIIKKKGKIRDVASVFRYENPAKFSAAFKKRFGILPSTLLES